MRSRDLATVRIECVEDAVVESLRRLTPAESIALINDANRTARALLAAGIKCQRPELTAQEVDQEVARRMLDGAD